MNVCLRGSDLDCSILLTARSISAAGILRSFVRPCETTRSLIAVEEIEDAVLHGCQRRPQFVDSVPQVIREIGLTSQGSPVVRPGPVGQRFPRRWGPLCDFDFVNPGYLLLSSVFVTAGCPPQSCGATCKRPG